MDIFGIGIFLIKRGDKNKIDIIRKISPEIFEKCIRNKPKITPGIVRSSRNDTTLNLSFELLFDIAIPIPHHGIEKNVQPSVTKITPNKRLIISKPS